MTKPTEQPSLAAMLDRIEAERVSVSAYHKLDSYNWKGDRAWSVDLAKTGEGLSLKAGGWGAHFESALRAAFSRFFDTVDHGVQFDAALPAPEPEEIDDSVPF